MIFLNVDPLTIGFSPCPNDTFIFYALLHKKIQSDLDFLPFISDVEELNKKVLNAELPVSKVSFGILGKCLDDYVVLDSGCAMGRGCGPLLVSKNDISNKELKGLRIAIPGENTTAALLLKLFDPGAQNLIPMPFFEIPGAVSRGDADLGLIIHETRFTYPSFGLKCIKDLGKWWEAETGLPIPLGGIVAKRSLGSAILKKIDKAIFDSVTFSMKYPAQSLSFIKKHAQETSEEVIRRHIDLYVNDYTIKIDEKGILALRTLIRKGQERGMFKYLSCDKNHIVFQR